MRRKVSEKRNTALVLVSIGTMMIFIAHSFFYNMIVLKKTFVVANQCGKDMRIVLISDLHNTEFSEKNSRLIKLIAETEPDIICMTGDMLNEDDSETAIVEDLVLQCGKIAPVFFSYGNHEIGYENNFETQLRPLLEKAGAVVLEQEYVDVDVKGQTVRIGGLYGYAMPTQERHDGLEQLFLEDFQNTNDYKILLCHMPVAWVQWHSMEFWDVDLVLSGHTHGGQVKVPFLGGIFAPDQGWFPDFTDGRLEMSATTLIVTAGLGTEGIVPRINNQPEIVTIELMSVE